MLFTNNPLNKIKHSIRKNPGIYSFMMYLIVLLIFSGIYYSMPGSFYHSTIQYEPHISDLKDTVCTKVQDAIRLNIARKNGTNEPIIGDWRITTVLVSNISLKEEYLQAKVYLFCMKIKPIAFARIEIMYDLSISKKPGSNTPIFQPIPKADGTKGVKELEEKDIFYVRKAKIDNLYYNVDRVYDLPFEMSDVHPCISYPGMSEYCFEAPKDLEDTFPKLIKALQGLPEDEPGRFLRMAYLSVVTLTTLGYGDIVPLTPMARFWVSLETFLGPVLLGIFLIALTSNTRNNRKAKHKEEKQ